MTKKKKEHIKQSLFKLLHVVSYILSGLFILLLVFTALKGCKVNNKVNNQSLQNSVLKLPIQNNSQAFYTIKYDEDFTIPMSDIEKIYDFIDVSYYDYSRIDTETKEYRFDVYLYGSQDTYVDNNTTELYFYFATCEDSGNYVLRLLKVYLNDILIIEKENSNAWLNDYICFTYGPQVQFFYDKVSNPLIDAIYNKKDVKSFVFNENLNYNAPLGLSLNSYYGGQINFTHVGSDTAYLDYDVGLFYSNNQYFNKIRYWCVTTNGLSYDYNGVIRNAPQGYYSYWMLTYINTNTNVERVANFRNTANYDNGTANGIYQLTGSTWQNTGYRYVNFININNDDYLKIDNFNNNNQVIIGGNSITGRGDDVFTLFTSVFTSLTPLWSIMILPNISLGILIFLPLVVFIIIFIVHILKK